MWNRERIGGSANATIITNSAIKALEVLSRIRSTKEEEAVKSIAELEQEIVNSLEILGEERTSKIFMNCSWFSDEEYEEHDDC